MSRDVLIKSRFRLNSPSVNEQSLMLETGAGRFPDRKTYFSGSRTLVGVEVEVEGIGRGLPGYYYWTVTEDGSLKDNGVELVSPPLMGANIDYALAELEEFFKEPHRWSHRCSIHVHANVLPFSEDQVHTLAALYACLETLFFSMVESHRKGNPYCYPITDLHPESVVLGDAMLKYCAFNIGNSCREHGTVEFRHMNGSDDIRRIRRWIQLIVKLIGYVQKTPLEKVLATIKGLHSESSCTALVRAVFGNTAILFDNFNLKEKMRNDIVWAKCFLDEGVK